MQVESSVTPLLTVDEVEKVLKKKYLTSLELEDYGELEDRILYAIYYGPCGLKCKDPSAVEIDSQVEVQCPERVVRKDEQPMDLDLIINDIQNKLCF